MDFQLATTIRVLQRGQLDTQVLDLNFANLTLQLVDIGKKRVKLT